MDAVWALEPAFAETYLQALANITPAQLAEFVARFPLDDDGDDDDDLTETDAQGMATIHVTGPLSQRSTPGWIRAMGYGGTGYGQINAALEKAVANPAVKSIQLAINSPGGEIHGVDTVWQKIRDLSATKPIGALNTGMIASAAYYIASACQSITANAPTCETGSIGVIISGVDTSKADEKFGYKRVTIVSKNAPDKLANFTTEEGRKLLQDRADAFEAIFHQRVATGRGVSADTVAKEFGRGGMFIAQSANKEGPDAMSMGLIDAMGPCFVPAAPGASASFRLSTEKTPASAGETIQEVKMNFDEFLAANPDAKARYEKDLATARAEGIKAAEVRAEHVGKILASDAYKANTILQAKAVEALSGKMSVEAFDHLVAMADMITEAAKLSAAEAETKKVGESAGQQQNTKPVLTAEAIKGFSMDQYLAITKEQMDAIYASGLGAVLEARVVELNKEAM